MDATRPLVATRVSDLKASDVMALFPDPDAYGGEEYCAIHAMLSEAMSDADDYEEVASQPFDFASAILRQFDREIEMMRKLLMGALTRDRL